MNSSCKKNPFRWKRNKNRSFHMLTHFLFHSQGMIPFLQPITEAKFLTWPRESSPQSELYRSFRKKETNFSIKSPIMPQQQQKKPFKYKQCCSCYIVKLKHTFELRYVDNHFVIQHLLFVMFFHILWGFYRNKNIS